MDMELQAVVRLLTFCEHLYYSVDTSEGQSIDILRLFSYAFVQPPLGFLDVLDCKEIEYPFDCIPLSKLTQGERKLTHATVVA